MGKEKRGGEFTFTSYDKKFKVYACLNHLRRKWLGHNENDGGEMGGKEEPVFLGQGSTRA